MSKVGFAGRLSKRQEQSFFSAEEVDLHEVMEPEVIHSLQQVLDKWNESRETRMALNLFNQIQHDKENSALHFKELIALLPASVKLIELSDRIPEILLPSNREALRIG